MTTIFSYLQEAGPALLRRVAINADFSKYPGIIKETFLSPLRQRHPYDSF